MRVGHVLKRGYEVDHPPPTPTALQRYLVQRLFAGWWECAVKLERWFAAVRLDKRPIIWQLDPRVTVDGVSLLLSDIALRR